MKILYQILFCIDNSQLYSFNNSDFNLGVLISQNKIETIVTFSSCLISKKRVRHSFQRLFVGFEKLSGNIDFYPFGAFLWVDKPWNQFSIRILDLGAKFTSYLATLYLIHLKLIENQRREKR